MQRSVDGKLLTKIYKKLNSEALYEPWTSFSPIKVRSLDRYGKAFYQTLFSLRSRE